MNIKNVAITSAIAPNAIRECLRAFADANVPFIGLCQQLNERKTGANPRQEFHIYQSDRGGDGVYVVLGVTAFRRNGIGVCWSLSMTASSDELEICCAVEVDNEDEGCHAVFERQENTSSSSKAAEVIAKFTAEVCAQVDYFDE